MQGHIRRAGLILTVLGGVCTASVPATDEPAQAKRPLQPPRVGSPAVSPEEQPAVTLDFPGGTVQEFVDLLKASTTLPVNVMMSPDASRLRLGPVRLERCPIWIALGTIEYATEDSSLSGQVSVSPITDSSGGPPLNFAVKYRQPTAGPPRVFAGPMDYVDTSATDLVGTYSISQIVRAPTDLPSAPTLTIEQLTQALDAVLRLTPTGKQPPSILVHSESGLLVVQGNWEQLRLTKEVIGQLKDDLETARRRLAASNQVSEAQSRLLDQEREAQVRYHSELADLRRHVGTLQDRYTSILQDQPDSPMRVLVLRDLQHEMDRTRDAIARLEDRLREARLGVPLTGGDRDQVEALRREIAELKAELQAMKESKNKK